MTSLDKIRQVPYGTIILYKKLQENYKSSSKNELELYE